VILASYQMDGRKSYFVIQTKNQKLNLTIERLEHQTYLRSETIIYSLLIQV
jgi:hypothetical protein